MWYREFVATSNLPSTPLAYVIVIVVAPSFYQPFHIVVVHIVEVVSAPFITDFAHPAHPLADVSCALSGCDHSELSSELPYSLDAVAGPLWEHLAYLSANGCCHPRSVAVRRHHDLKWSVAVDTAKVEVALRGDIGNIGGHFELL